MKDTLASLFNMLPQPFRELDFSMLVRRYLNMFFLLVLAYILGLSLAEVTFATLFVVGLFYLCAYLAKSQPPAASGAATASAGATPDSATPQS